MTDYSSFTALQLGEMIKNRELTSPELCEYFLNKADGFNSFIYRDKDAVMKQAQTVQKAIESGRLNSVFAGVPIAIKDNICVKGMPASCGSKMLESFVPPYDATVVSRIKNAGMVVIGKTNMDEFAMGSTGETSHFGAVKNPLDVSRAAGGSSSGSAAAVAGGLAPLSLGSDTGGSVRLPAAYCGLYGLKPTYGAVSRFGLIAYASSLDTVGVISKTAEDAAVLFNAISGVDKKDSTSINSEKIVINKNIKTSNIKISILGNAKSEAFKALNINVENAELSLLKYAVPAYYIIACAEASSNLARYDGIRYGHRSDKAKTLDEVYTLSRTEGFGFEVKKRIMLGNFVLSSGYFDEYYLKALKVRGMIKSELLSLLEKSDYILAPVSENGAPLLGQSLEKPLDMYSGDVFNVLANLAGLPALSLPGGVQLIGKPNSEESLINLALKLEKEIYGI